MASIRARDSAPAASAATRACALIIVIAFWPQTSCGSLNSLLDEYDKSISSSLFGEPVFRLEPPNVIHYSSAEGVTLLCLASGSSRPSISWFTHPSGFELSEQSFLGAPSTSTGKDSLAGASSEDFQFSQRPVTNISNVRVLLQDGAALKLLPFDEAHFRREVHSADYRCVASNQAGSIHSKSVTLQAVLHSQQVETLLAASSADQQLEQPNASQAHRPSQQQQQESGNETAPAQRLRKQLMEFMRVNDEFVQLSAPAVLKCRIQSALANRLNRAPLLKSLRAPLGLEWFTSDGFQVSPGELSRGHKFVAFESGELHVLGVEMEDLRRTYGCRLRNLTSRRVAVASNMAQMILIEPGGDGQQAANGSPLAYFLQAGAQRADQLATVRLESAQVSHTVEQMVALEAPAQSVDFSSLRETATSSYFQSYTTNAHRPQAARSQALVLPCAVSLPLEKLASWTRWLYLAPAGQQQQGTSEQRTQTRPVPIEHLAATNNKWLQLVDLRQPQQSSGQSANSTLNHFEPAAGGANLKSRLLVGPTYLAIERARAPLSGRYLLQLTASEATPGTARNLCDINVIIRQPIRLQVRPKYSAAVSSLDGDEQSQESLETGSYFGESQALASSLTISARNSGFFETLSSWLRPAEMSTGELSGSVRHRRHLSPKRASENFNTGENHEQQRTTTTSRSLLEREPMRVRVAGPGATAPVTLARVGDRLELECSGAGHPIESLRWFRQGQAINTQTPADFQTEIVTVFRPVGLESAQEWAGGGGAEPAASVSSRLLIRQLQARDAGLLIFECFAQNALGDRARASATIFVAERELLDETRQRCPLADLVGPRNLTSESSAELDAAFELQSSTSGQQQQLELRRLFRRANPLGQALVFEGEPIELECPAAGELGEPPSAKQTISAARDQVQWFRWTPWADAPSKRQGQKAPGGLANRLAGSPEQELGRRHGEQQLPAASGELAPAAGQFNQLFGGDSRFVINGSSLQIRSPSRRHDETLFVCLRRPAAAAGARVRKPAAGSAIAANGPANSAVHQSSLAGAACLSHLFAAAPALKQHAGGGRVEPATAAAAAAAALGQLQPRVSSISIRIVGKPKIDPFEFSRNLEEGMRTMVVCTVVSGQSLVDINWFKDGELLTASPAELSESDSSEPGEPDESAISVQRANEFSSTLTIRKIRPGHSGLYTCIASNALAAAEHTSRLLINVAPYFIEAPRSQRAYLRSNVLINCRAGGQPSPQIRWRKLVPVGSMAAVAPSGPSLAASDAPKSALLGQPASESQTALGALEPARAPRQLAPSGGLSALAASDSLADYEMSSAPPALQTSSQTNLRPLKREFRIITSNSHIQILENGSMIIKEVELGDAARYSCQASNGIQPILSEVVELEVLQPAQFESNFETLSVKRGATVRFSCAPRGDQPIRLEWSKEGSQLLPVEQLSSSSGPPAQPSLFQAAYSETIQLAAGSDAPGGPSSSASSKRNATLRTRQLMLTSVTGAPKATAQTAASNQENVASGMVASELLISSAERAHSGLFVCSAQNAFGRDELTYRLLVQEPPDAPLNLQLAALQANSLKLLWQSPFDGNLPISHFVIEHRQLGSAGGGQQLLVDSPATSSVVPSSSQPADWLRLIVSNEQSASASPPGASLRGEPSPRELQQQVGSSPTQQQQQQQQLHHQTLLKHLSPKSTYQIRVAAVNALGQGPFSPIQLATTAEEAPQARAAELRAQPLSSTAIKLSWRGPLALAPDEPAPIRGYHVSYRRAGSGSTPGSNLNENRNADGNSVGVSPGWLATLSISSSNYTASSASPGASPSELLISATGNSPASAGGKLAQVGYELLLSQLERNAKYEIRVQPYNSMGLGPASELTGHTLPFDRPAQPQLKLVEARKQSLELKWSLPGWRARATSGQQQQPEVELLGFSLYYKCEYDDWQELQLGLIFRYVIESLRCGNKYQIYLSAFNSVGRSEPSEVLLARTEGTAPLAPDKSHFFKLNISEVQLDLGQWSSGGCPISSFMVQFKRLHDSNWFILSEGATPFTQTGSVTIPDLTPATWYKLLVTALNEAGSTNAEYVFGTLTLDGQQLEPPSYLIDQQHQTGGELRQPLKAIGSLLGALWQLFSPLGTAPHQRQQHESQLLLPLSCLLLLLVTTLAAFLFYSRSSKAAKLAARHQQHEEQQQKCRFRARDGATINCELARPLNQLQLFDRHLLHAHCNGNLQADSSSSSSTSASGQQQQQVAGAGNTLARQHAMLAVESNQQQVEQSLLNGTNYVLDSFLDQQLAGPAAGSSTTTNNNSNNNNDNNNPTYSQTSSFVHCHLQPAASGREMQLENFRLATMKLVPSQHNNAGAYCFAEGAGSSSMSSSGLGSVQTTNSASSNIQATSKNLQLIDERSQPAGGGDDFEPATSNYLLSAGHFRSVQHSAEMPPASQQQQQLFQPVPEQSDFQQPEQLAEQHFWPESNHQAPAMSNQRGLSMAASSSFASAADLAVRQQQQANEPIYQRLDKFKSCALPACRQFASLNPQFADKFKQNYLRQQQQHQYALDDRFLDSTTTAQQAAESGLFAAPPPPLLHSFDYQPASSSSQTAGQRQQQLDLKPTNGLEGGSLCSQEGCLQ